MSDIDICMYHAKNVYSSRTHEDTIDVEFGSRPSNGIRIFLSIDKAKELIDKMQRAIYFNWKEEKQCDPKGSPLGGATEAKNQP